MLNEPHGGALVNLLAGPERAEELRRSSRDWPSWTLTPRQLCDLELLATGAFSPLRTFLGRSDYVCVVTEGRLADGTLWPVPVVLDVSEELTARIGEGRPLALRDPEGVMLAVLHVHEAYRPDRRQEASCVYGTTSPEHPGVAYLLQRTHPVYLSGALEVLQTPVHYDFPALRRTPADLRAELAAAGWERVVAFQTRNPMHRAHVELTLRAAAETGAGLLIHPVVGMTKPGDVDHYTRVRCYQAVAARYPAGTAKLALLPLAMRMAGPREAVWHAIIRKNFGATHFIVGRDHAGPGRDSSGRPFYDPYAAQDLLRAHEAELGVRMVPFRQMVYLPAEDRFVPEDEVPAGAQRLDISGTELRRLLERGDEIPSWFTYPEVASELRRTHPPRWARGLVVLFTGLSGSGKSTIANALRVKLLERGRRVTLLDGDLVRRHLSSELGFSREHRDLNIRRIGFVASEVARHGGVAICAPIAPYDAVRREVRRTVTEAGGGFVLVWVATPLEVCEARDRKGLYAKARAGLVESFTGISDPYEPPSDAEVVLDTTNLTPDEAAGRILAHLEGEGYLRSAGQGEGGSAASPLG